MRLPEIVEDILEKLMVIIAFVVIATIIICVIGGFGVIVYAMFISDLDTCIRITMLGTNIYIIGAGIALTIALLLCVGSIFS